MSDFKLICRDTVADESSLEEVREIPVHRILLRQASEYFRGLYDSETIENKDGYVIQPLPYNVRKNIVFTICFRVFTKFSTLSTTVISVLQLKPIL